MNYEKSPVPGTMITKLADAPHPVPLGCAALRSVLSEIRALAEQEILGSVRFRCIGPSAPERPRVRPCPAGERLANRRCIGKLSQPTRTAAPSTYPPMRKSLLGSLLCCVLVVAIAQANPSAPEYSMTLTTSSGGISAACEIGCAWKTLTARYPSGTYRLTDRGVFPVQSDVDDPAAFAFVLTTNGKGIEARCEKGCNWKRLSAAGTSATYQLDQSGVQSRN